VSHCLLLSEGIMKKAEQTEPKQEETKALPDHTDRIVSQVLAKTGTPPRLDHVEVSRHPNGNYRVNIWQQALPGKDIIVTVGSRIWSSYYLKVSSAGEITYSNPPLAKLRSST
jgi:hypothetical protein